MEKIRKTRSSFPLKDKNDYKSYVIYERDCSCCLCYIGETKHNAEVRWNEHYYNPTKSSKPSKHLRNNIDDCFAWTIISSDAKNAKARKNLEALWIDLLKSDLNKKKDFERLVLFRNGVTYLEMVLISCFITVNILI